MDDAIYLRQCPHCQVGLSLKAAQYEKKRLHTDPDGMWELGKAVCPACDKLILWLVNTQRFSGNLGMELPPPPKVIVRMLHPRALQYRCPPAVPVDIAADVNEAALVLSDSPRASAALSRRALQSILRTVAGVKQGSLGTEIDEIISSGKLPDYLNKQIDAVRNIGNFAAHPIKNQNSGEIVQVEAEEAQWCLYLVSSLIHHFYVVIPDHVTKNGGPKQEAC